ncbi:GMC oxidoreductase-domain-containing protein [Lasiosphaeris hirsuta]|uniref:GMC oxidoreductase-domain-containing protein n=1 Tax=Lasiosphaeris hirsuta TaxID=260670 RepID=A0AA40AFH3_9PEZI|nr:GMC oxidoreductase-domain-containing protein [Lasiosphaeris hirsuta]
MDLTTLVTLILFFAWLPTINCIFLQPTNITDNLLPSYDYIVVGGGVAGLVVANRLSENSSVTVLILESGELDASENTVTVPGLVGHGHAPSYGWNFSTAPQQFLDGKRRLYDQGHVVGGGSILNGLVTTRGAAADYDSWSAIGNPGWGWLGMLPYFKKCENFTVGVDSQVTSSFHIDPVLAVHGTSGPLQVTYPKFLYPHTGNFLEGLSELGVPAIGDPNAGWSSGAMIVPASMTAEGQARADSRGAYLDGVMGRPNLHLASEQTVTRILIGAGAASNIVTPPFGHLRRAFGVEFTLSANSPRRNITCTREVILAGGGVLSPVLLQVSGIGPAPILKDLGIPVQVDLPGVGHNLQDHVLVDAFYNYTEPGLFTTRNLTGQALAAAEQEYFTNHTGPWTAPLISAVAFPPLALLSPSTWTTLLAEISSAPPETYLPPGPGQHPTLVAGFARQRQLLIRLLSRPDVGALEIMADSIGTLTGVIQRPFSRGSVRPRNADILAGGAVAPNIDLDPRYCAQAEDCEILALGLQFNSKLVQTEAMSRLSPSPRAPWDSVTAANETALLEAIREGLVTEFHPCGTAAMMPLELGGVVDPRLLVYGTENLRVVDAAIIPIIPAAHLQAGVYAVAEKAADIIKEDNSGTGTRSAPTSGPRRRPRISLHHGLNLV